MCRSIRCKLYANGVRTRLTIKLVSNLNYNKPFLRSKLKDIGLKKTRPPKMRTSRIRLKIDEQHKFSLDADFVHGILQKRKNGVVNVHIASEMI